VHCFTHPSDAHHVRVARVHWPGILTAGLVKTVVYSANKIAKMRNATK
jgi:hypothetical protein